MECCEERRHSAVLGLPYAPPVIEGRWELAGGRLATATSYRLSFPAREAEARDAIEAAMRSPAPTLFDQPIEPTRLQEGLARPARP